jgi:hypothetical protein
MPVQCSVCCISFDDIKDLKRHYGTKKHLDMVKKASGKQEEKEEMADPRLLDKETIDFIILNHDSYLRVGKELTDRRQKLMDRFEYLHNLFLNYREIDYSKYNDSQKEYYSENFDHPDLLKDRYPHLSYSAQELKDMLEEKDALVDTLLKVHREYDREKPKWYQLVMNELIAEYRNQEKEIEKKAYKDLKMKQLLEMMAMKN